MISSARFIGTFAKRLLIQAPYTSSVSYKLSQPASSKICRELLLSNSRHYSASYNIPNVTKCKELEIPIIGGNIAAKAWGSESSYPVIAFHGWLDNCGSFDKLIPLLSDQFYFVAIDAPGHGKSFHKPPGCIYTDISMVMDFKKVIDALGWTKFHVMGHSLGGLLGMLFACVFPDSVHKLITLECSKPYSTPDNEVIPVKFQAIKEYLKIEKKMSNAPPIYSPENAAKRLKAAIYNELNNEEIEILLERGTKISYCGKGVVFTRDLRCLPIDPISVRCENTIEHMVSGLKCDLLIILANDAHPDFMVELPETVSKFHNFYKKHLKHFVVVRVEGNHFVHINNPQKIAPIINEFLLNDKNEN